MATTKFFDRYVSTLASSYTSGGTSLSVASAGSGASALPSSGDFYVVVEAEGSNTEEVLLVTAVSGTTLTVAGAKAGTSASNHASGATIRGPVLTADAVSQMKQDIASSMTVSAFDTETTSGTLNPAGRSLVYLNDGVYRCLWTGTAWEYHVSGLGKVVRPVLSAFTAVNGTGATAQASAGCIHVKSNAPGTSTENYQLWVMSTPAAPYTVTLIADVNYQGVDFNQCGVVLRESSTGKFLGISHYNSSSAGLSRRFSKYSSSTAVSADYVSDQDSSGFRLVRFETTRIYLRAVVDASNVQPFWSMDGLAWESFDSARSKTDFLASGPNQFGWYISGGLRASYARILQIAAA